MSLPQEPPPPPPSSGFRWLSWSTMRLLAIGWLMTTITNFPSAYTHTSINSAVEKIDAFFNVSYADRGMQLTYKEINLIKSGVNSGWYAGQVLGAVMSPFLCDVYGRKVAYLISVIMMTGSIAIQCYAVTTDYPEFYIFGRMITAVFSPLSDAAFMIYMQEISPTALRGTLSSLFSTGYAIMCLSGMVLGHEEVMGSSLGRLLFVPIIPGVLSALFVLWMPDTPKFLMTTKKDKSAALRSLKFFQGDQPTHLEELAQMEREGKGEEGAEESGCGVILGTAHLRHAFILAVCALVLTLPFYPVLQASTHFFINLGVDTPTAQLSSSLLMVILTATCLGSTAMVDRVPRRHMLITAGVFCALSLSLFAVAAHLHLPTLAMACVHAFMASYGLGIGPVAWFISPELVPTAHRSVMFCMCYGVHSILVVVTNFSAIPLFDLMGASCFVPIYVVPLVSAAGYLYLYLPETRGRETSEIVEELKSGHGRVGVVDKQEIECAV